jgi:hypothetical protein
MIDTVVAGYDVPADEARADVQALLAQLLEEGLVLVTPGEGEHVPQPAPATGNKPYERPHLQVYRDMEDLLALDPPAPGMNQISWADTGR